MRKGIYRGLCLDHRVRHVGVGIDLLVFMWLVWVRAPVHHEWGEVKERSSIGFDHSLDDVNNTAMAESVNLQQRGVVFRLELFPFYREADEHCQRTPTILYLERIRPILEVVVQSYVLRVCIEITQVVPFELGVLCHLCEGGRVCFRFCVHAREVRRHIHGSAEACEGGEGYSRRGRYLMYCVFIDRGWGIYRWRVTYEVQSLVVFWVP